MAGSRCQEAKAGNMAGTTKPEKNSENMNTKPNVGIFWLVGEKLIIDLTPISHAETYGDCLGHPTSHLDYWTELQRTGIISADSEYEDAPRGRIVFNSRDGQYILYADKCIREKSNVVRKILRDFCLPEDGTVLSSDEHYRCRLCLYGSVS